MQLITFFRFIIRPRYPEAAQLNIKQSIQALFRSFLWYYGFVLIASVVILLPLVKTGLMPESPRFSNRTFFDMVIFAPVIEELIFRLPLRNFFRNIFVSLGLLFYAATNDIVGNLPAAGVAILIASLPYFVNKHCRIKMIATVFFEKHFKYFFYTSAFLFGALHILNFESLRQEQYWISPLLVSFQILMGFIFGYLRISYKYGIIYSILAHALINLPLALLRL